MAVEWTALLVVLVLAATNMCQKLKQEPVVQPTTGLFVGQRDAFPRVGNTSTHDTRVVNYYAPGSYKLKSKEFAIASLGLSNWGPLQTSLLMTEFPQGYERYATEPFCAISDELINYKLRTSLKLEGVDSILDLTIFQDQIFLITSDLTVVKVNIVPEFSQSSSDDAVYHPESSSIVVEWTLNLTTTLKAKYNQVPHEGGIAYDPVSKYLYFVSSDVSEIVLINTASRAVTYSASNLVGVRDQITYVAIKHKILYIAQTSSGIKIVSIADPTNPKLVTTLGMTEFGANNHPSFSLVSLDVDDYQLEILNTPDKAGNNSQQLNTDPGALFRNEFTLQAKLDFIQKQDFRYSTLLVLTDSGVFVRKLPELNEKGQLADKDQFTRLVELDSTHLPIMLTRFNSWVYVLSQVTKGSVITEILLTGEQEARVNRVWNIPSHISKIYVDDKYLYTISDKTNVLFERGIGGEWLNPSLDVGKVYSHGQVLAVSKAIINGYDFLIVFTPKSVEDYMVQVSDPHIRCPPRNQKEFTEIFGTFKFQLNATVRNCPRKIKDQMIMGPLNFGVTPCLLEYTFELEYSQSPFYNEKHYLFGTAGIVGFILLALLLCACCYRRRLKMMNSENEALKREIMMFKEKNNQSSNAGGVFMPAGLVSPNKYKLNKSSDSFSEDRKSSGRDKVQQSWNYAQGKTKTLETDGV